MTTQTAIKERPIIFSAPMIQALQRGKSETRRVIKPQPETYTLEDGRSMTKWEVPYFKCDVLEFIPPLWTCPYGQPGDRLWVRETWDRSAIDPNHVYYKADNPTPIYQWNSPIFMPRWASRFLKELTGVSAARPQDMTEADAIAEGFNNLAEFAAYWDIINPAYPFTSNPWWWVLRFRELK